MKNHRKRLLLMLLGAAILLTAVMLLISLPTQSVWEIAGSIRDGDSVIIWIGDSKHHVHAVNDTAEQHTDALSILRGMKLSCKAAGTQTLGDAPNRLVLETTGIADPVRVQYFCFNADFTLVWATDNSWIYDRSEPSQFDEDCPAYRVQNPGAVRRLFAQICSRDTKYQNTTNTAP